MRYVDLHTHRLPQSPDVFALVQDVHTWGLHPWHLTEADAQDPLTMPNTSALCIGECGLDRCCSTPYELQVRVFHRHIQWSEAWHKPLIVHCVKAVDDVVRLRRATKATQPWVFHGFRGKPQQLKTLLSAGFYISFGAHYNEESLRLCPLDRLFLETDDAPVSIQMIYERVANVLHLPLPQLMQQIETNVSRFLYKS